MSDFMLPQMHEVETVTETDLLSVVVGGVDKKITVKNFRGPPSTVTPDLVWTRGSAANALDDEFDDASLAAAWVRYDTVANVVTYTEDANVLSINHLGSSSDNAGPAHCLLKPISGATSPLVVAAATRMFRRYSTNYQMFGLIITDGVSASSKGVWMMPYGSTAAATANILSTRTFAALNGGQTSDVGPSNGWEIIGNSPLYQRLTWVSANTFRAEYSPDGVSWLRLPASDFTFTMTPTHIGFAISNWQNGNACLGSVEHFRVS